MNTFIFVYTSYAIYREFIGFTTMKKKKSRERAWEGKITDMNNAKHTIWSHWTFGPFPFLPIKHQFTIETSIENYYIKLNHLHIETIKIHDWVAIICSKCLFLKKSRTLFSPGQNVVQLLAFDHLGLIQVFQWEALLNGFQAILPTNRFLL